LILKINHLKFFQRSLYSLNIKNTMSKSGKHKRLKLSKEERERQRASREHDRQLKKDAKEIMALLRREHKLLRFMRKTRVLYYHHGRADSLEKEIDKQLLAVKNAIDCNRIMPFFSLIRNEHSVYHPYVWNYYGEGNSRMSRSLLGRLWAGKFDSIYDVPLDGSYIFYTYDSGQRGLGAFDYITAIEADKTPTINKPNPGSY
jgi:hypothetical protein